MPIIIGNKMQTNYKINGADLFPLYKPLPPFMDYHGGYGFMGVILEDRKSGKIQCHICGGLFKNVARHSQHKHDMLAHAYKELTGLNEGTPLVCESTSRKIREAFTNKTKEEQEQIIKTLRANNKFLHSKKGNYHRKKCTAKIQQYNSFGTCDLQAKARFWEEYRKLGRIPTNSEMSRGLASLVYTRFDSYENALKAWGIGDIELKNYEGFKNKKVYDARKAQNFFPKYEKEVVINQLKSFYVENSRLPTWTETKRLGFPSRDVFGRIFGTKRKDRILALIK